MKVVFDTDLKLRLPKLGECTVRDDKDTLPLQMADMLAGYVRQQHEPNPRIIRGCYALQGLFSAIYEIRPKALNGVFSTVRSFTGPGSE
jgi:hypothetical protein